MYIFTCITNFSCQCIKRFYFWYINSLTPTKTGVLVINYNGFMQVGVGTCMEGIEQNPVVYELMSEMAFRYEKVQVLVIICF